MKIEIWSDIMCPFCYIGKGNFEIALEKFKVKNHVQVEWKSFQLDPTLPDIAADSQADYLAKRKGMSIEQVEGLLQHVTQSAKAVGLDYQLDKAIMVNSFKAHRLIQKAKEKNIGDKAEEVFFQAFFIDSKNIADLEVLSQLGKKIGLSPTEIDEALSDDRFAYLVNQDIQEAQNLGINGVPFFVFDRKYGISGAQPPQAFVQTLEKAFAEWREKNPETKLEISTGEQCSIDGNCE